MNSFISNSGFNLKYFENNHPSTLMVPFREKDIFLNRQFKKNNIFKILKNRHPNKYITLTYNARDALRLALLNIDNEDKYSSKVRIQTTSDNLYISSCVTHEIEKNNSWYREGDDEKDVLLINHEFGYSDNRIRHLVNRPKWIIEDCAFSFNSKLENGSICGSEADYSVYSFSKFFPLQFGGYLVSDNPIDYKISKNENEYIGRVVTQYAPMIEKWSSDRQELKKYYDLIFKQLGCSPEFQDSSNDVPGAYLFNLPEDINKDDLKRFYWSHGIQCTAFYGRHSFILPLHQFITNEHIEYFAELFTYFQDKQ